MRIPERRGKSKLASLLVLALGGLAGLTGCASWGAVLPELDMNPIVRIERTPDGGADVELLGPFVDMHLGPDVTLHRVVPLFQHKRSLSQQRSVTDVLPPLGCVIDSRGETHARAIPLLWDGTWRNGPDGRESDLLLFPLTFYGSGPTPRDNYLGVFPLGGRIRGLFGVDQFDFALWPLFMRTKMNVSEPSTSTSVLLLAGWTEGGPRDGSWRAYPFYGKQQWTNPDGTARLRRHTVMWPFLHFGDEALDTRAPAEVWGLWPFYSQAIAETWQRRTVLWPFFRWNRETNPDGTTLAGGDYLYDTPWPLFRRWKDGDETGFGGGLPPYHDIDRRDSHSTNLLLYWDRFERQQTAELGFPTRTLEKSDTDVFPFFHTSTRAIEGRAGLDTNHQIWPLWHRSTRVLDDTLDRGTLSLVPLRHIEFFRGADEVYSPLFTIWRQRRSKTTDEHRGLFDLLLWRRSEAGLRVSTPLIYARRPEGTDVARHQLLWGLSTWRTDAHGVASWSVMGIDLWTR